MVATAQWEVTRLLFGLLAAVLDLSSYFQLTLVFHFLV